MSLIRSFDATLGWSDCCWSTTDQVCCAAEGVVGWPVRFSNRHSHANADTTPEKAWTVSTDAAQQLLKACGCSQRPKKEAGTASRYCKSVLTHAEAVLAGLLGLITYFAGPPRFSAATSHEQNDAYMQEFDTAYAELEAMSLVQT